LPRPHIVKALQWLGSLVLLAIAINVLDWTDLCAALLSFSPWMAALVVLLNLAEFPLMGWRWHLLSGKVVNLPFPAQLGRYCAAQFFNSFTPGQLGGDAYRFLTLQNKANNKGQLAAIIVQERLVGLAGYLAAFLLGAVMFEVSGAPRALSSPVRDVLRGIELLMSLALVGLLMIPLIVQWIERIGQRLGRSAPKALMMNLHLAARIFEANNLAVVSLLTAIAIAGWCLTIWLVAADLQVTLSMSAILMIATLSELIRVIPITVQGLGLRESTFAAAFALSGQSAESGFVVGSIAYAALTLATLLSGVLGLLVVRSIERGPSDQNS
jgi:uncharacterized protein (TIRG00374 family)